MRKVTLKRSGKITSFTYLCDTSTGKRKKKKEPMGSLLKWICVLLSILILVLFAFIAPMEKIKALKELVQAFAGLMYL